MEREASQAGVSDRERRERLERLQVEVRQAKARLESKDVDAQAAVKALEDAVARARERLHAERMRAGRLRQEFDEAEAEVASLQGAYAEVAARQLGSHLAEGFTNLVNDERRLGEKGNGPDLGMVLLVIPLLGVAGLLLALMVQGCLK